MESRSEGIGGQFSKHLPVHRHRQEPHDNCQRGSDAFEGKKNDRAKALLEYRARCTSARFWVQSQLLDLRLGLRQSQIRPTTQAERTVAAAVEEFSALEKECLGELWSIPGLLKQHLKSPYLSKLVHRDPLLARRLNILDDILWHRFGKRQGQTAVEKKCVWMPHEEGCPHVCGCVVPGLCAHRRAAGEESAPQTQSTLTSVDCPGPSRTSTADSFAAHGVEARASEKAKGADSKTGQDAQEPRPVTVMPSCRTCLEHLSFIIASLLLFLKPSELRDLALERQQYQCCGFVFCARRNVESPEKHQAALWRWTLEFAGLKTVTKDELLQFCCGHCWSRQQQLLQLLDEEPMYTRPGIREWISEVIERKNVYRAHPHSACSSTQSCADDSHESTGTSIARDCPEGLGETLLLGVSGSPELSNHSPGKRCDAIDALSLDGTTPGGVEGSAFSEVRVNPIHVDFSGDTDDSEEEVGQTNAKIQGSKPQGEGASPRGETGFPAEKPRTYLGSLIQQQQASMAVGRNLLMLNYQATDTPSPAKGALPCVDSSTSRLAHSPASLEIPQQSALASDPSKSAGARGVVEAPIKAPALPEGVSREGAAESDSPSISRLGSGSSACSSRPRCVRFADESHLQGSGDAEATSEAESDNACSSALTHYYNLSDEDDGLSFYARNQRTAPAASASTASKCPTGELRSILKPTSDIVAVEPDVAGAESDLHGGYMRLSDVVIAFDLVSSCCTDSSAQFLREYHRRFCTCTCSGSMPAAPLPPEPKVECDEAQAETQPTTSCRRERRKRHVGDAEDSDSVSCIDGESGDEVVDPADLWQRRQQQLLTGILRSLPPSAESFAPLLTELCRTFRPVQPLPTLRCSLCTCLAALLLLVILLLRAKPLTCCCCCEGCRPWDSSHRTRSKCQRRAAEQEGECQRSAGAENGISFYFDDALTLAKEEDVGLAVVDFVRSTIQKAAPFGPPLRLPGGNAVSQSAPEGSALGSNEEQALHVLLESIFSRISRPLLSGS